MTEYLGEILNQYKGRVVIAPNPNSTNANLIRAKIDNAISDFIDDPKLRGRLLVLRERDNYSDTLLDITETLRSGDILVAAGGDGTASGTAQTIMEHPNSEIRDTPLLILPGGNANLGSNDLLNKMGHSVSILQLLAGGEIVDFRPMELQIENPLLEDKRKELAFFLSGFGITARAVSELEKRRNNLFRKNSMTRLALDGISVISGAIKQNREPINFSINGFEFDGAGILTANVDRYAKILPTPSLAIEEGFDTIIFPDTRLSTQIKFAGQAMLKNFVWLKTNSGEKLEIIINARPNQKIQYDIDAEPRNLPSYQTEKTITRITQEVHDQSIKMITF